jgi:hypothetical protein
MKVLVKDGGFERALPSVQGFAIPVEVGETDGTFQMDFTNMPTGDFNISGVDNSIKLAATTVTGTIDAGGNVALPPMLVRFTTDLLPGVFLDAMEPITTGLAAVTLAGRDYATEGAALDFSTGSIRLEGQGIVTNAPVVGSSTSGVSLACTLAPVPVPDQLQTAPSLKAHATSKPGKPQTEGAVAGDVVTFKGKIKSGDAMFDPTQDVFVRIGSPGADLLLVRVPAGGLTQSGKKFSATDDGGATIHVVTGRKQVGNDVADVSGSLVIVKGKKTLGVTLKHTGADMSSAASTSSVLLSVGVGSTTVSDTATVKSGAKKTVFR